MEFEITNTDGLEYVSVSPRKQAVSTEKPSPRQWAEKICDAQDIPVLGICFVGLVALVALI
jgi:hypothetical protein